MTRVRTAIEMAWLRDLAPEAVAAIVIRVYQEPPSSLVERTLAWWGSLRRSRSPNQAIRCAEMVRRGARRLRRRGVARNAILDEIVDVYGGGMDWIPSGAFRFT